jgi:beta-N-acetylhexosaminidase
LFCNNFIRMTRILGNKAPSFNRSRILRAITPAAALLVFLSIPSVAGEKYHKAGPVALTKDGRKWVEKTLKYLSLQEKVGQMLQVRHFMDFQNFNSESYLQIRAQLEKYHVGSIILTVRTDGPLLLKDLPLEVAAVANRLQRDSKLPLLLAAGFERGLSSRLNSVPVFPDAMAFGATWSADYVARFGVITAEESRAIGIHWNLFPVADVNINPANPIINTRSFGEDPEQVASLVAAFIKGARSRGMLTSAKHFPGHGDTGTDSHLGVARLEGDLSRLDSIELPPFRKAIDAGVDSIMVAHVAVPALEPNASKVATVSSKVVTEFLKNRLGFKGVVVTDALEMRGVTGLYPQDAGSPTARAAVDAVKAGNDMVMWPTDLDGAFNGIIDAVKRGEIPESQIDASVRKILDLKASIGLHKARLVDLEQVPYLVSKPENVQFAQQVADQAVTLVRSNGQVLPFPKLPPPHAETEVFAAPMKPAGQVVAIVISDSVSGEWGRAFERAFRERRPGVTFFRIDNFLAGVLGPRILQAIKEAERVVVATYVAPTAGKRVVVNGELTNTVDLQPASSTLLGQILEVAGARTAVVAVGNPYVAQNFPAVQTYLCTFSDASSSEVSAVKALFGELQSHGKLPVTLPGIAQRGFYLPWPSPLEAAASR